MLKVSFYFQDQIILIIFKVLVILLTFIILKFLHLPIILIPMANNSQFLAVYLVIHENF